MSASPELGEERGRRGGEKTKKDTEREKDQKQTKQPNVITERKEDERHELPVSESNIKHNNVFTIHC